MRSARARASGVVPLLACRHARRRKGPQARSARAPVARALAGADGDADGVRPRDTDGRPPLSVAVRRLSISPSRTDALRSGPADAEFPARPPHAERNLRQA